MKTLITIFLFLLSSAVFADDSSSWENSFILRAGLSFNMVQMETGKLINNHESEPDDPEDETRTLGFGGFTSIAYRVKNWEFGIASDFVFGRIRDVTFISDTNSIRGGGSFRLVSFGPQIKYYTPWTILNKANIYIGGGPAWSLQTFVFSHSQTTGNFNDKKRISFENYGGGLCIGIEQIVPSKSMHPIFVEVGYSYMHSYRVSILDASDTAEVITLSESESNDFSAKYLIIRAGMALF